MEFFGNEILENKIYIVMNKPKGYVCSAVSDSHKTIYELLPNDLQDLVQNAKRGKRLHSVGRLDCETSGLLFITTDGKFSNFLTRPENNIKKTYLAILKNPLSQKEKEEYSHKAKNGILLPAEKKAPEELASPAIIDWNLCDTEKKYFPNYTSSEIAKITVTEGKFHEVRRIFKALGNEVIELKRIAIQDFILPNELMDGNYKII